MEKIQVQPTAIVLIILAFPYRFSHATLKAISHVACSFAVFAPTVWPDDPICD